MLPFILTAFTLGTALLLLGQMLWLGHSAPGGEYEISSDGMRRFLVWKAFYVNPDDPRGWVPKTWGFGQTVNFRNRRQVAVFVALLLSCMAGAAALTLSVTMVCDPRDRPSDNCNNYECKRGRWVATDPWLWEPGPGDVERCRGRR